MSGFARRFFAAAVIVGLACGARTAYLWHRRASVAIAAARKGLDEYAALEQTYKAANGRYADSLFSLAGVSVDPRGVLADAPALFDQGRVDVTGDKDRFSLTARATDPAKTVVALTGP